MLLSRRVAQAPPPSSSPLVVKTRKKIKKQTDSAGVTKRPRPTRRRKNMMTEAARKAFLERDEWTRDVEPWSVRCAGCHQTLSLDKRNGEYYACLWLKHRACCREIKSLEMQNKSKEKEVSIALPDS
jgi:gamma-glutamyltranspeptidase